MRFSTGYTLIEGLVALLVISLGLLGTLSLQSVTVSQTLDAGYRTIAAAQTANVVADMQITQVFWSSSPADLDIQILPDGSISDVSDGGTIGGQLNTCLTAGGCSAMQMATARRLAAWADNAEDNAAGERLPGARLQITRQGAALPAIFEVSVSWLNRNTGSGLAMQDDFQTGNAVSTAFYSLRVQI